MIKTNLIYSKFLSSFITSIFIISLGIFLVLCPKESYFGVKEGINMCLNILIPSLFPFIFFSSLIVNSGVSKIIGNWFCFVSKHLFFLPSESFSVIILSLIGGFPVGAKGIVDLFEKNIIDSKQAERMLGFCVNAGPAFILGVIGNSLIHNMYIANIILISQIISSLLIATISGILSRKSEKTSFYTKKENNKISFICALIDSCESSSRAIIDMCVLIIFFNVLSIFLDKLQIISIFTIILSKFGFSQEISKCFPQIIMEVTKSCKMVSQNGIFPCLLSFATSWGGFCVHFQVFSIVKKIKINYLRFFAFRILNAFLSSFLVFIITKLENVKLYMRTIEIPQTSTHILGSIAVICCCLIFLLDINLKNKV